jgi:glycosyltransferase involved in cell wall biosynthesis
MREPSNKSVRIGLIGPVLPYRGGIAQYTTMLHRALRSRCDLITISFKRQYPKWLYPGKSDLDPEYTKYKEPKVFYTLEQLNPITWLKVCHLLISHSTNVVIIPWWTVFWAPCFWFISAYLRYKGIQVLFLCHNILEHESAFWRVQLTKWIFRNGSCFVVHAKEEASNLNTLIPNARISIHSHPIYNQFPHAKGRLPRRSKLELLFYGFVRSYKGLPVLVEAMHLLKGEDVFLTVAGEWWEDDWALRKRIEDKDLKDKIEVIDRYVTEKETAEFFCRADVVVLPYRSASGTGVIALAYHYRKPVIATIVGGLPDVVDDGVSGRLVKPEDPYAMAEVIREFLHKPSTNMRKGIAKVSSHMTWDSLAKCIINFVNNGGFK